MKQPYSRRRHMDALLGDKLTQIQRSISDPAKEAAHKVYLSKAVQIKSIQSVVLSSK